MSLRTTFSNNMPRMPGGWQSWRIKLGCVVVLALLYGGFVWHMTQQHITPRPVSMDIPVSLVRVPPAPPPPVPPIEIVLPPVPVFPPPDLHLRHG